MRRFRKNWAIVFSIGGLLFIRFSSACSMLDKAMSSSTFACFRPRSISRSLKRIVFLPFCSKNKNASGTENFVA